MLKNNIAWCLVELDADPHRALALASEGASWAKQQAKTQLRASCLGTLGAAQFRNGQHEAAIVSLRESLSLHTNPISRSSVLYYLGEALRHSGRIEQAVSSYQQSRDQDPEGRHGKLAAARLAISRTARAVTQLHITDRCQILDRNAWFFATTDLACYLGAPCPPSR